VRDSKITMPRAPERQRKIVKRSVKGLNARIQRRHDTDAELLGKRMALIDALAEYKLACVAYQEQLYIDRDYKRKLKLLEIATGDKIDMHNRHQEERAAADRALRNAT